jgi:5-enolpyruvylshikimate-3-phosphate synthase/chorismate mutase
MTEESKNIPSPAAPATTGNEILDLDGRLTELLVERAQFLARIGARRRGKHLPLADPTLERTLWTAWEKHLTAGKLSPKLWKQLFVLANAIAYDLSETGTEPSRETFVLAPGSDPADVDLPGPVSQVHVRLLAALAAASGQAVTARPVILSDPLVELAKALNQVGGSLSWEESGLVAAESGGLAFEGHTVFAGHDPFNFCLLLALGLTHPGRSRFSGGPELKMLDLSAFNRVLPALGARLAPIDMKSPGLPARLEAGGPMAPEVKLEAGAPEGLAAALATAGWTYPEGLSVLYPEGAACGRHTSAAAQVLRACGIAVEHTPGRIRVRRGEVKLPEAPLLPLDGLLCAYLLALPAFRGGRVRMWGAWPAEDQACAAAGALLAAAGLNLNAGETSAVSEPGTRPDTPRLEPILPELVPLAVALVARLQKGGTVLLPAGYPSAGEAMELAAQAGCQASREDRVLTVTPGGRPAEKPAPFAAPDPTFAMALGLVAHLSPGLTLANPGIMASLWPGFFSLYNRLPHIRGSFLRPTKDEPPHAEAKKRRRVRV